MDAMVGVRESADDVECFLRSHLSMKLESMHEDCFVNFMVFCWQSIDPGRIASLNLSVELVSRLANQLTILMERASRDFPRWSAPAFWRRYIGWTDYGEEFSVSECRKFMMGNVGYLEPAFYICSSTCGQEMEAEALALSASYSDPSSMRARYVLSVVTSVSRMRSRSSGRDV